MCTIFTIFSSFSFYLHYFYYLFVLSSFSFLLHSFFLFYSFWYFSLSVFLAFLTAAFSQLRAALPLSITDGTFEASSSVSVSPASLFLLDPKSPFQLAHLSMFSSNLVLAPDSRPVKSPLMASGFKSPAPFTQPIFL